MSLLATPREILTGRVTNIVIRSTTGGWTPGNPGSPILTVAGATGDSIVDQVILDPFTAAISLSSAQANAQLVLTDSKNKEACSVNVYGQAQFTALGRQAVDDNSKTQDGKLADQTKNQPVVKGKH